MRRAAFLIFVLGVFAAMTAIVAFRVMTPQEPQRGWGGFSTPVATHTVAAESFADIVEALGTAGAAESVTITARVSDTISQLYFDSGQRVEAGDILAELTDTEEAAGLAEARATQREAGRDLERVTDLIDRGVAARQRLDEANAALDRARARVNSIEAQLADRIIRAPFSGVVGLREVSTGGLVRPGDSIARLDDTSTIKLDFTVPERFIASLAPGMTIAAQTSAYEGEVFEGTIRNIDSRIDPVTRAVIVRAEIDNADGRLLPGQLMSVEVQRDIRTNPAVPGSAITRYLDDSFVFVVDQGEQGARVRQVRIEIGRRDGDMVEISSGVDVGEVIVRHGVHRVRDGMPVSISDPVERGGAGGVAGVSATARQ